MNVFGDNSTGSVKILITLSFISLLYITIFPAACTDPKDTNPETPSTSKKVTSGVWPFTEWSYTKAYTYNFVEAGPRYQMTVFSEDGQLNPYLRSEKSITNNQALEVQKQVNTTRGTVMVSKCPFPRHAVVFFNDKDRPVGEVGVCFECGDIIAHPDFDIPPNEKYAVDTKTGELKIMPLYDSSYKFFEGFFQKVFKETIDWEKALESK